MERSVRLTLMCRNHEAIEFTWDYARRQACGKITVIEGRYVPVGCRDTTCAVSRAALKRWLAARSIPSTRPEASARLAQLGYDSPLDLLVRGRAMSLSDQYWLKAQGQDLDWAVVSPYLNDFPQELGRYLISQDVETLGTLAKSLSESSMLLESSPDAALGGNLMKRWELHDGVRALAKGGHPANRLQEPFNEAIVTRLCGRLLGPGEYLPYELSISGLARYESLCPCMCDDLTELVPAMQILGSCGRRNDASLKDAYLGALAAHGVDARRLVEKMLVVDYIVANFDRHWNNFGVLMDSETREWRGVALLFDNGECLWCDREATQGFGGGTTCRCAASTGPSASGPTPSSRRSATTSVGTTRAR